MNTMTDERSDAFERAMHRTLVAQETYLKKIHSWVRFFGICAIVWIVLGALGAMAVLGSLSR